METRYNNRTNRKVATESAQDGCQVYPNCLECPLPICIMDMGVLIRSTPDAMAHMLQRHGSGTTESQTESEQERQSQRSLIEASRLKCPDCNTLVEYREGCETCPNPIMRLE